MMHTRRSVQSILCFALIFLVGCVRICDQRITLRYDEKVDTLYVILHYDGVHDSGSDRWGKGAEQLAKSIDQGGMMLLDWPLQLNLAEIRELANDATRPADERALTKAIIEHVHVEAVGRYRDALGRIGGVQLITITKASELVDTINAAINAAIRANKLADFPPYNELVGTRERILAAAEKNHPWLALEGHALRISMPVHEQEWAVVKAKGIYSALMQAREEFPAEGEERTQATFTMFSRSIANVPFAYGESNGIVTFRVGDPARPTTIRLPGANDYAPNLENELTRLVEKDIDSLVARRLAGENIEPADRALAALVEWGPPEESVRAMARAAESDDAALAKSAHAWLSKFSADWNRQYNLPKMPAKVDDPVAFARACLDWCREVREFPNPRSDLE